MNYDICVFGGCALDSFYYKDENGNIPKLPSLILPGGKAANQAVAASRAGAKVTIISKLGKDDIGQKILSNLVYNNITTNNVEMVEGLQNDCANIIIDEKTKDNEIIRFSGAIESFTPDMIEAYKNVFLHSKIVVAQMKAPKEVSVALINFCYDKGIPLIITPCRPKRLTITEEGNSDLIDKISYITANRKECLEIFGTDDVEECITKYPNKLIVTLGEDGVIYHNGKEIIRIPAVDTDKIEDTTGAGDTFNGNFAAALSKGYSLYDAVVRAQYSSSMKIQVKGAQDGMPYQEELDKYIVNHILDDNDYTREFDLAYSQILSAYERVKKKKIANIKIKDDETFVTESDYFIEKMLIDAITEMFPDDNFVTEEFNNENIIKDRTWVIDPIDGTAHYMKGSIFWGIQLAFVDKGETQFSIIYLPKLDELYYAIKGEGVYLNHKKIKLHKNVPLKESIIEFCGSVHKKTEEKEYLFKKLLNNSIKPANYLYINSCCIGFTNILSRRSETLIVSTKNVWDVLPGLFMLYEAGVKAFNYNGIYIYSVTDKIEDILN